MRYSGVRAIPPACRLHRSFRGPQAPERFRSCIDLLESPMALSESRGNPACIRIPPAYNRHGGAGRKKGASPPTTVNQRLPARTVAGSLFPGCPTVGHDRRHGPPGRRPQLNGTGHRTAPTPDEDVSWPVGGPRFIVFRRTTPPTQADAIPMHTARASKAPAYSVETSIPPCEKTSLLYPCTWGPTWPQSWYLFRRTDCVRKARTRSKQPAVSLAPPILSHEPRPVKRVRKFFDEFFRAKSLSG
jgi:hypothetical protein